MTDRIRTELIDRFRSGLMSSSEEAGFRAQLAADSRLNAMLKADDLVASTIRKDIASIATDHPVTRARAMEALARVSQPTPTMGSGAGASYGAGVGGSMAMKVVVSSLLAVGLAVGVYTLWPSGSTQSANPTPAVQSAAPNVAPNAEPNVTPNATAPRPSASEQTAQPESTRAIESTAAAQNHRASEGAASGSVNRQSVARERKSMDRTVSAPSTPTQVEQAKAQSSPREIPVRNKEKVDLKIDVKDATNKK